MKRVRKITHWLHRYRVSHGFGVHSPSAFNLITKVIGDKEAYYYAYPEIDSLCGKSHRDSILDNMVFSIRGFERQEARMLFRLLCHFNPDHVIEVGGGGEVTRTIIDRAIPRAIQSKWSREDPIKVDFTKCTFIIVNYCLPVNFAIIRSYLLEAIKNPSTTIIFFRNLHLPILRKLWREFEMVVEYGQSFHDDLSCLYVSSSMIPYKDYELNV